MYILKTRKQKRSDSRNFVVSQYAHTHETAPPLSHVVLQINFHRTGEDINVSYLLVSLTLHNSTVPKIFTIS
jgi:hypothetical protein